MDNDDLATWEQLAREKAARARRRIDEAVREPGHLRAWFASQDWFDVWAVDSGGLFRQLMRSFRHSCHSACCAVARYEKRRRRRSERHAVKVELGRR